MIGEVRGRGLIIGIERSRTRDQERAIASADRRRRCFGRAFVPRAARMLSASRRRGADTARVHRRRHLEASLLAMTPWRSLVHHFLSDHARSSHRALHPPGVTAFASGRLM